MARRKDVRANRTRTEINNSEKVPHKFAYVGFFLIFVVLRGHRHGFTPSHLEDTFAQLC